MTVKASKVVKVLLSTYILLTFITNSALCKDSELIDELEGKELSLSERLAKQARLFSTDNLLTANLNGYYDTMVYYLAPEDLNILPGFNTTKSTTVALLGHFALILSGLLKILTFIITFRIKTYVQYKQCIIHHMTNVVDFNVRDISCGVNFVQFNIYLFDQRQSPYRG